MIYPTPRRRYILAAISLTAMLAMPAAAQSIIEDYRVYSEDIGPGDNFGSSIAISGTSMLVGALGDDDNGDRSGSAYLFNMTSRQQILKLVPNDGSVRDWFGNSVALSDSIAVVGAFLDDPNGEDSGSAYLFDTTTGEQIAKLLPDDGVARDQFGMSVAISGNMAIVGASKAGSVSAGPGAVYIFDVTTSQQLAKIVPNDSTANNRFGTSVAISGTTALIGAPGDTANGEDAGSAYLYDTITGQQIMKLLPNDGSEGDQFGVSVAINAGTAVIGAMGDDEDGDRSGSAYLFDLATGQQIAKLLPNDGSGMGYFGSSVAIGDSVAIVGSFSHTGTSPLSGSAYLFETVNGQLITRLVPSDGSEGDFFGISAAISGSTAVVGATYGDGIEENTGSVYVFITHPCPADLTNDGSLDSFDVSAFLNAYAANDPTADFNTDGSFNFFDVSAFVEAFLNGCP